MHSHELLKTAMYLSLEVRKQLDQERVANCSDEHFLLHNRDMSLRNNLHGEKLSAGFMATL